jgi:hypothetical protein
MLSLTSSAHLQVRNLQNEITKKCAPPGATTDAVFYAGTGLLLCRSEDKVRHHACSSPACMHARVHTYVSVLQLLCWPAAVPLIKEGDASVRRIPEWLHECMASV